MDPLYLTPEVNLPMPNKDTPDDFMAVLNAAAETAKLLAEAGLDFGPTNDDLDTAAATVRQAARDPTKLNNMAPIRHLMRQTPGALLLTKEILDDFGHQIVQEAAQVRHMVTNKLIELTENPDPRVKLRALEMLGKIGDVGLFNEKREVVVTHQTTADVKERLRSKLEHLLLKAPEADILDIEDDENEDDYE
jgi:hypothetical protein